MPVSLEVRLVGDDPEQKKAFDRASHDAEVQADHAPADSQGAEAAKPEDTSHPIEAPQTDVSVDSFLSALDDVLAETFANAMDAIDRDGSDTHSAAFQSALDDVLGTSKQAGGTEPRDEHTAIDSIDALIEKIDELLSSDRVQKKDKPEKKDKEPQTELGKFFNALDESVNKKLDAFGIENTKAGRVVSNLSGTVKRYGTKFANSKMGKSVAGSIGRTGAATAGTEAAAGAAGAGLAGAAASAALPITAMAVVAAGAALTLKGLTDAVQSAANELTDLSPELASVRSQFQLTRELARLDRADRIGAGAAQLEAARSRISDSMYEVQTKILDVVLKFAPLLEVMLDGINVGVRGLDSVIAAINVVAATLTINPNDDAPAQAAFAQSAQELAKAMQEFVTNNGQPQFDIDPFLAEILNVPGNPPPMPRAPRAGGRP